jgi:hypothetical protein
MARPARWRGQLSFRSRRANGRRSDQARHIGSVRWRLLHWSRCLLCSRGPTRNCDRYFGLDLDRYAEREFSHPDRGARVPAALWSVQLHDQIGKSVDDGRLLLYFACGSKHGRGRRRQLGEARATTVLDRLTDQTDRRPEGRRAIAAEGRPTERDLGAHPAAHGNMGHSGEKNQARSINPPWTS